MRPRQVVVTGLGAETAFGSGVSTFWGSLLEGRSAIAGVRGFEVDRYQASRAAQVVWPDGPGDGALGAEAFRPDGPGDGAFGAVEAFRPDGPGDGGGILPRRGNPQAWRPEGGRLRRRGEARSLGLAFAAAGEAVRSAGLDPRGERVGVVAGTTLGGNLDWSAFLSGGGRDRAEGSTLHAASSSLARALGARGPVSTLSVACASGTAAIGLAAEWIREGLADAVVAGGYDALSEFVFSGFDSLRALSRSAARPFDARRDGLTLGEGAGFLVLEAREAAERRGAAPLAVVSGYASSSDAHHMTRPPAGGEGLCRAGEAALGQAGLSPASIGFVSAHGTATVFNDRMEAAAFRSIFGERARELPVNSIKGAVGHTLGAAGALEGVLCVKVLETAWVPPTAGCEEPEELGLDVVLGQARALPVPPRAVLSTSAAFGGTNAALVLERP